jgi:chemotaxis protein methyltransferase CheR
MITQEQFKYFALLVKRESGISLADGKEYLVESRLNELAKILGLRDINDLYNSCKNNLTSKLKDQIVDAMTTNETYFFRDQHPFDCLKKEIVPEHVKKNGANLKIWCAACSTGQEPYSISMLFSDFFPSLNAKIIATDISPQVLNKAKHGKYSQIEVNRGLQITLLIKHFKQAGAFWEINDSIKKRIDFKSLNLIGSWGMDLSNLDIVFCRYVLIYFEQDTKKQILEKIERSLNPGGCLFLGATETPIGLSPNMKKVISGKTTYWVKEK